MVYVWLALFSSVSPSHECQLFTEMDNSVRRKSVLFCNKFAIQKWHCPAPSCTHTSNRKQELMGHAKRKHNMSEYTFKQLVQRPQAKCWICFCTVMPSVIAHFCVFHPKYVCAVHHQKFYIHIPFRIHVNLMPLFCLRIKLDPSKNQQNRHMFMMVIWYEV